MFIINIIWLHIIYVTISSQLHTNTLEYSSMNATMSTASLHSTSDSYVATGISLVALLYVLIIKTVRTIVHLSSLWFIVVKQVVFSFSDYH